MAHPGYYYGYPPQNPAAMYGSPYGYGYPQQGPMPQAMPQQPPAPMNYGGGAGYPAGYPAFYNQGGYDTGYGDPYAMEATNVASKKGGAEDDGDRAAGGVSRVFGVGRKRPFRVRIVTGNGKWPEPSVVEKKTPAAAARHFAKRCHGKKCVVVVVYHHKSPKSKTVKLHYNIYEWGKGGTHKKTTLYSLNSRLKLGFVHKDRKAVMARVHAYLKKS